MRQHSGGSASKRSISANRLRTRLTASIRWRGERRARPDGRGGGRAPLHQRSKTRFRVSAGRAAQHQQVQAYVQRPRELYQRLQPGRAAAGFQLAYKHRGYTDLLRQLFLREPRVPACKPDARADLPIVHLAPSRCCVLILAYS